MMDVQCLFHRCKPKETKLLPGLTNTKYGGAGRELDVEPVRAATRRTKEEGKKKKKKKKKRKER